MTSKAQYIFGKELWGQEGRGGTASVGGERVQDSTSQGSKQSQIPVYPGGFWAQIEKKTSLYNFYNVPKLFTYMTLTRYIT